MAVTRRSFLAATAAAATMSLTGARRAPAQVQRRRTNVLFIAVDDLRPQLGCYGHEQMISPHIDALGARGTVFRRAYCQQAVCAPSRASVMSGCRPDTTTIYDLNTPLRTRLPDVLTLPQCFRQQGYVAESLGKIYHHGKRDDPEGWSSDPWTPRGDWKGRGYLTPEAQAVVAELQRTAGRDAGGRGPAYEAPEAPDNAYPDGLIADEAIARLAGYQQNQQPFFLGVGFMKPHLPFNAPKRYWDLYPAESISLADNPFAPQDCPPLALHNWGELRNYPGIPAQGDLSEDLARTLVHGYYACTSYTDAQIGRVVAALGELGLADHTVIVLWGDHGWQLGEHGLWCKHSNFETSCHSPLVLAAPGQANPGVATTALTEFVDIYPTLCELTDVPAPPQLEGDSLVPLQQDPSRPWKPAAWSQYPRGRGVMGHSIKTDQFRFTLWRDRTQDNAVVARELYDHHADPAENVNVAERPEQAETVARLTAMIEAGWQAHRPPA